MMPENKYREIALICAEECRKAANYCSDKLHYEIIEQVCQACAVKCEAAVDDSENQLMFWECGVACLICADRCEGIKDPNLDKCVQACRKCEEASFGLSLEAFFSDSEYAYARL